MQKEDGALVGCISLSSSQPQHRKYEIGYWVGRPYWGKGYATEAARRLLPFAFEVLEANKVYGRFFSRNPASGKVMVKIGMTYEGTLRRDVIKWGIFEDLAVYSILRSEFVSAK